MLPQTTKGKLKEQQPLNALPKPARKPVNRMLTQQLSFVSSSSSPTEGPLSPQEYLKRLHKAAQDLKEVPQIPPSASDIMDEERVVRIQDKVIATLRDCRGTTSDGRWSNISETLKLECTLAGTRYIGTRLVPDKESILPETDWILAETEEEWKAWEKQRGGQLKLKKRVKDWAETIEFVDDVESLPSTGPPKPTTKKTKPKKAAVKTADEPPQPAVQPSAASTSAPKATIGFPVVKRNSKQSIAAGKPAQLAPSSSPALTPADNAKDIRDVSESDFLPPSFPSQLPSSTPNANKRRRQPSPIPQVPLSSPLPSQDINDVSMLSASPIQTRKRRRSGSNPPEEHANKHPRITGNDEAHSSPSTSKRPNGPTHLSASSLPKLTDLIKSDSGSSPGKGGKSKLSKTSPQKRITSGGGSSAQQQQRKPSGSSPKKDMGVQARGTMGEEGLRVLYPTPKRAQMHSSLVKKYAIHAAASRAANGERPDDTIFSSPLSSEPISFPSKVNGKGGVINGGITTTSPPLRRQLPPQSTTRPKDSIPERDISPAKSMTSIADDTSDEEDGEEDTDTVGLGDLGFSFNEDEPFEPMMTSTQHPHPTSGRPMKTQLTKTYSSLGGAGTTGTGTHPSVLGLPTDPTMAYGQSLEDFATPSPPSGNKLRSSKPGTASKLNSNNNSMSFSSTKFGLNRHSSNGNTQSQFQFGYNSQFNVEGNVDEVSKLLEKDVDMDFDEEEEYGKWMREPTASSSGGSGGHNSRRRG